MQKIDNLLARILRQEETLPAGKPSSFRTNAFRIGYIIIKGASEEQLILRAMSLVYTSLLSFVPVLAVSFSVLKAFGVHTRFLIVLYYFLEPLGENGIEISMKIIGFIENVQVSVLGSIGLSLLIYTVISTIQKIESALNYIWHIEGTRGFSQRFSNYMSVLLVGPVLIVSAVGITASLMNSAVMKSLMTIQVFGVIIYAFTRIAPYVLIAAAFTLIYIFLPNTRVRFRAALAGGITAAALWQTIGWIFTSFIASSAQYSAIYSGFASLILFLIWLYWNYLTLLIGAKVSFYVQHPRLLETGDRIFPVTDRLRERLALTIMLLIGRSFHEGGQHWKFDSLAGHIGLPPELVLEALSALEKAELLVPSQGDPPAYLPARETGAIPLGEIINSVRIAGKDTVMGGPSGIWPPGIDDTVKRIEHAINASLEGKTLKDLLLSTETGGR